MKNDPNLAENEKYQDQMSRAVMKELKESNIYEYPTERTWKKKKVELHDQKIRVENENEKDGKQWYQIGIFYS